MVRVILILMMERPVVEVELKQSSQNHLQFKVTREVK